MPLHRYVIHRANTSIRIRVATAQDVANTVGHGDVSVDSRPETTLPCVGWRQLPYGGIEGTPFADFDSAQRHATKGH